jgi:hypothetical protein
MVKKVPPKKHIITVPAYEISPYELEGPLGDIRILIDKWIQEHGSDARLNWDPDNWPQYQDSPSPQYEIMVSREETDAEFDKRVTEERIRQEAQDARDRKELERLQAKFGVK